MLTVAGYASAFEVSDTAGKRHSLEAYKGRWVVLNFWATWCVPCLAEIPEIAEFARTYPRVVVIGVAMDAENPAKVKQFAQKTGHTYPLVLADDAVEKQLGEPKALPTTRVYDPAGKVVYDRPGRVDVKALEGLTRAKRETKSQVLAISDRETGSSQFLFPHSQSPAPRPSPPTPTSPAAP